MAYSRQAQEKLLRDILGRAARDAGFRQRLLAAPTDAIYEGFGVRVPRGYRIRFIERDPELDALIVLPNLRVQDELTLDELEGVAGGVETDPFWLAGVLNGDLFTLGTDEAADGDAGRAG